MSKEFHEYNGDWDAMDRDGWALVDIAPDEQGNYRAVGQRSMNEFPSEMAKRYGGKAKRATDHKRTFRESVKGWFSTDNATLGDDDDAAAIRFMEGKW